MLWAEREIGMEEQVERGLGHLLIQGQTVRCGPRCRHASLVWAALSLPCGPHCPLASLDLHASAVFMHPVMPAWELLACFFSRKLFSLTLLDPTECHPLWEAYPEIPGRVSSPLGPTSCPQPSSSTNQARPCCLPMCLSLCCLIPRL